MEKNNILIIAVIGTILMSNIAFVYAISGFQTYTKFDDSGGSSNAQCGGIAITPSSGYVGMVCDAGSDSVNFIIMQSDGTRIAISNISTAPSTSQSVHSQCYAISSTVITCSTGSINAGQTGLVRATVTSASSATFDTLNNPCALLNTVGASRYTVTNGNFYGVCNSTGNIVRISGSSITQTGTFTDLQTGTPTCTTVKAVFIIVEGKGVAQCNTILIAFTYSGSSGSVSKGSSIASTGYAGGSPMQFAYDGSTFLYITHSDERNALFYSLTSSLVFSGSQQSLTVQASDIRGVSGGYWLLIGNTPTNVYLLSKSLDPPNNLVVNQAIGFTLGVEYQTYSADSINFVFSKGDNGNNTSFFIKALQIRNENDSPIIDSGSTGGIDCSAPANVNILTCRLAEINQTPLAGASQLTNQSATDLSCQIGIIACTDGAPDDTNIQTNGVGYILLFVALGIWVGLLFVASKGQIVDIPNFVWMIGTIAVVGAVTIIGWIDPTIFIVSIITVVALAGIKAKNVFGGVGGLFKGEES